MAVVVAGCVVSDPPEYGVGKQTPPFLDLTLTQPNIFHRVDLAKFQQLKINVPVRSEDAADGLVGLLILNNNVFENGESKEQLQGFQILNPSTFDDTKRSFDFTWSANLAKGCYQLSLVVTHSGNLNGNEPKRTEDTAFATWWVDVDDDGTNVLQDCPERLGGSN